MPSAAARAAVSVAAVPVYPKAGGCSGASRHLLASRSWSFVVSFATLPPTSLVRQACAVCAWGGIPSRKRMPRPAFLMQSRLAPSWLLATRSPNLFMSLTHDCWSLLSPASPGRGASTATTRPAATQDTLRRISTLPYARYVTFLPRVRDRRTAVKPKKEWRGVHGQPGGGGGSAR